MATPDDVVKTPKLEEVAGRAWVWAVQVLKAGCAEYAGKLDALMNLTSPESAREIVV